MRLWNTTSNNKYGRGLINLIGAMIVFSVNIASVASANEDVSAASPAKIAVLSTGDFIPDRTGVKKQGLPDGLAARIMERLTESRRFVVLERTALRSVILEQRFGEQRAATDVDRLLDEAVSNLDMIEAGTLAAGGVIANSNDALKDFQDLGTAAGADYMLYAKLEKLTRSSKAVSIPHSNRKMSSNNVDARLYLRLIDANKGQIVGAESIRVRLPENVFIGGANEGDEFSIYDELGAQAASKVIDMVYPARVIGSDPWVVSRGSNDGVKIGDIYDIQREGKSVKGANGVVLGRIKTNIGQIKITQIEKTFSIVDVIEGVISEQDLAVLVPKKTEASNTARQSKRSLNQTSSVGSKELPRVAIGLVKLKSTASTGLAAEFHISTFTDTIISKLVQTKRFQLIDRQEVDQLLDEQVAQALSENRALPSAMGTLEGADYLIYGSIASFQVVEDKSRLPGSSRIVTVKKGFIEGNIRIVDARSGNILESKKVSIIEKIKSNVSGTRLLSMLNDAYAEQIVINLMSVVYPIKVAALANGTVYINRGEDGGLFVGETLQAFRLGEPVIDPDTGIQLGMVETFLGTVKIVEVEGARAKGKTDAALQSGDLLKRRSKNKGKRTSLAQGNHTPKRSGSDLSDKKRSGKATLAVGKVRVNRRGRNSELTDITINSVTNDLIVKLSQDKHFDVMERQEIDQIIDEKAFSAIAKGGDIGDSLSALSGADYLVHATIDDFYILRQKKFIEAVGRTQITQKGIVEANLRIVDVHSGKVVAASKIRINQKITAKDGRREAVNGLIDEFTTDMVDALLANLFPNDRKVREKKSFREEERKIRKVTRPAF